MGVTKFNYKIRNTETKKYWSTGIKATWLQAGAAADQARKAMQRWGASKTEVLVIPLTEVPGIPAQEFIDSLTDDLYTEETVQKTISSIIRYSYKIGRANNYTMRGIRERIWSQIRSKYKVQQAFADTINYTEDRVLIGIEVTIKTNRGPRVYNTLVTIDDKDHKEHFKLVYQSHQLAKDLKAAQEAKTLEDKETSEYQLFLNLHKKFGDRLNEALSKSDQGQ